MCSPQENRFPWTCEGGEVTMNTECCGALSPMAFYHFSELFGPLQVALSYIINHLPKVQARKKIILPSSLATTNWT